MCSCRSTWKSLLHLSALTTYAGRRWLLQPPKSTETFWGTKEPLPASLSHCDPAIVQFVFWENDGPNSCRTCNALNKQGKKELQKTNSRPVYQWRLNGFTEKRQKVCAFTPICLHGGEDGSRFWLVTFVLLSTSLPIFLWGIWWRRKSKSSAGALVISNVSY